ncbi:MAG: PAS domain-containing protein [Desulfosarcina sp.]|nr:PAS domain-containing protein [Desulfobacterales bacterium]
MIWEYNPLMIPLGVAVCVCLTLLFVCGRYAETPGVRYFNLMMLAMAIWTMTYALELGAVGLENKRFWSMAQYLAIPFVPCPWLAFLLMYSGHRRLLTPARLGALALIPVLTTALALTNSAHGLVLKNAWLEKGPAVSILVREFGPWFWVHTGYSYILLAGGCVVIIISIVRSPDDYRGQRASLLLACVLPWISNAVYIFGVGLVGPHVDPTPFFLTLSGLLLGWSIFQGRLFDIVPIGHGTVIRNMRDGVIFLDARDRVIDINPSAHELIRPPRRIIGQSARQALGPCRPILRFGRETEETVDEIALTIDGRRAYFDLYVTPIRQGDKIKARLFVLRNVTERRQTTENKLQRERLKAALETAGTVCHKLNQPLQGISGYAELLLLKIDPADEAYAKIEGIMTEATRMGDITNKLLNITCYRTARYTAGETIADIGPSSSTKA